MTFEDDTTCCKMHKLGVFPFFVTIGDILQHKLYSVITIGVMLRINLKLVLVLVLRCNLPSQIVTPLVKNLLEVYTLMDKIGKIDGDHFKMDKRKKI